jgi:CheY-like chemotaxis protein
LYILVIEDDVAVRNALLKLLEKEGHTTCWAANGEGGLRMMRSEKPDLVLLDMIMPGMTGWEVARERLNDPELRKIPVIILSGLGTEEIHQQGQVSVLTGIALIMGKPFDAEDLLNAIDHLEELKKLNDRKN